MVTVRMLARILVYRKEGQNNAKWLMLVINNVNEIIPDKFVGRTIRQCILAHILGFIRNRDDREF
jgi:hypothetical protein